MKQKENFITSLLQSLVSTTMISIIGFFIALNIANINIALGTLLVFFPIILVVNFISNYGIIDLIKEENKK